MDSLPLITLLKEFGMSVGDSRVSQRPILLLCSWIGDGKAF